VTFVLAASEVVVTAPSPLEGEGSAGLSAHSNRVRGILRRMLFVRRDPLTLFVMLNDHLALSLKGRGHNHAHPDRGEWL
jgi:hypothetical protein